MSDVIGLVLPFFGVIFVGFLVARITRQPLEALGWMNIFIVYVALPACSSSCSPRRRSSS
jgi:predicted permease